MNNNQALSKLIDFAGGKKVASIYSMTIIVATLLFLIRGFIPYSKMKDVVNYLVAITYFGGLVFLMYRLFVYVVPKRQLK